MKIFRLASLLLSMILMSSCGNNGTEIGGSGLIEATDAIISAQAHGQLVKLYFGEGQRISEGDTIAAIDTSTTMLQLRQAQAAVTAAETKLRISSINIKQADINFSLSEKEFKRVESLLPSGSANQQQYDKAKSVFDQASLAKDLARAGFSAADAERGAAKAQEAIFKKQIENSFPVAPFSGIIIKKYIDPGELVILGKPIVKIANLDTVEVKIYLPPSDLSKIGLGGPAKIDPENESGQMLDGVVTWISDEAEFTPKNVQTKEARADLVYAVKIRIPNPGGILKIGMPVSVVINE